MHEVETDLLWIGNAMDAREPRALFDREITAIVDLAYEEPVAQLPRQFIYCRFPMNDGGGNPAPLIRQAIQTTSSLLEMGTRTLIACSAGMSRSPTIAAFALASHLRKTPEEMVARIGKLRSLELNQHLWSNILDAFENREW